MLEADVLSEQSDSIVHVESAFTCPSAAGSSVSGPPLLGTTTRKRSTSARCNNRATVLYIMFRTGGLDVSRFLLLLISAAALQPQSPFIYYRGVVNVASYMPPSLPSGGIAQGAQFSIFGANLGPATSPALTFPLSTSLAGVTISVTQGTTTVAAIPVFLSPGQINAIMPSNTPLGQVSLRVSYNNFRSNAVPVNVVASAFGIFTSTGTGQGPGSIQNYFATAVPLNGLNAPATTGQLEILYGVGLGAALGPDNVAPISGNLPTQTEVFVGGVPATISYSGRASCCSGIDQITRPAHISNLVPPQQSAAKPSFPERSTNLRRGLRHDGPHARRSPQRAVLSSPTRHSRHDCRRSRLQRECSQALCFACFRDNAKPCSPACDSGYLITQADQIAERHHRQARQRNAGIDGKSFLAGGGLRSLR